jgi:hypothetical protein
MASGSRGGTLCQAGTCGSSATKKLYRWRATNLAVAGCSQMMSMTFPPSKAPDRLLAVVVVVLPVFELPVQSPVGPDGIAGDAGGVERGVADGPSGEGAGALPDVVLGVVADPHGE